MFSASLQCAAGLMNVTLRTLSLALEEREAEKEGTEKEGGRTEKGNEKLQVHTHWILIIAECSLFPVIE